ncbi:rve multi-domain protein [Pyrenophora tritici-repentis]|uniref:Rve multi-domain protein n=1 Tax=Pyrenophora tritici-repentis TaxID=45151 RepID=A0A922NEP7_9PLEO|nr:rve multi-domain protein [Pyrenophora tritici-repentis]
MTEVHFVSSASIGGKPSKDFSRQLEFPGSALTRPDCWQPISTLIDTGASACFVNQSWVNQHRLDTMPVAKPIRLSLANGGEVDKLTQAVDLPVRHGSHTHNVLCYVTNIGKYDVILGMNWMDYHQPALHFGDQRSLTFAKAGCKLNCLHEGLPETVYENGVCHSHVQLVKGDYQTGDTTTKTNKDGKVTTEETMADIYLISAAAATALAAKHPDQVIWLEPRHWAKLAKPPDEDREGIGVAAVSQTDFEKYMHKMEQPYMTRDQIGQLVPEWVLDELPDLFNPHLAHQLPERRPGVDPECRVATFSFHFDGGSRHAVYLANALGDELRTSPVSLAMMMYQDSETDDFSDEYLFALGDTAEVDDTSAAPLTEPDTSLDEANILQTVRQAYPDDDIVQVILKAKADGQRRIPYHLIHGPNRIRLELGDCSIHDGVFYVKKKVYIPESGTLRTRIIERVHRSYCGGHSGKHGSYDMLNRWYYWPKMINDVAQYVKNCLACRRLKSYRDGKHGLLHPLPIPERYWSSISMDYITHLPPCTDNGRTYTNVLVIVDRLSKKKKFIPVVDLKVDTLVKAFVEYVWREEGYPDSIVSDRGAQFLSHFWTRLCQRLGTKPKLSTGYHPETDGQTENANAWLKQYLRSYINYEQDNWALFLPMAEFEANNAINASTGTTAFRLTKGYDPKSGLEPPKVNTGLTAPARRDQDNANKFAEKLDALRKALRLELQWSQAKQAEYANDARLPAPEFKVGDQVMLDARNFRTTRPSLSLDFKNRGPFTVTRVIDNMAYELLLPPEMGKLHNVFHPWLLHLHEEAPLPGQLRDSAPAEFADPDEEDGTSYEVEAVLDSRVNKRLKDPYSRSGLLQYLVRWTNYPAGTDNPSWEPYMNLVDSADIVQQYHESRPKAPGPHRKFATLAGKQDLLMITVIASSNNPKPPPGAPTIQQTEETIGPRSFRNTGNIAV